TAAAYRSAYLGAQTAAGQPPLGLGGAEAGLGLGQGLVRLGATLNQRRQGVILESQPPVATGRPALRRHRLPALLVPNGGGVHGLGLDVVRPHSTGRQQNGKQGYGQRQYFHGDGFIESAGCSRCRSTRWRKRSRYR